MEKPAGTLVVHQREQTDLLYVHNVEDVFVMVSVSKLPRLHQRNGVYYFRAKLPDDIKVFFGGRREIKKSLMTCNLSESLERYDRINRSTEKLFNSIRRILITGTDTMLSEQQIAQLVDSYSRETLSAMREERAEKGHVETLPVLDELERIDEQLHDADYSRIMRTTKRKLPHKLTLLN